MLKRRRGKKEKLHLIMEKLGEKRIKEDEKYQ
jgi:Flp pilus assembly CpaE family ATPase